MKVLTQNVDSILNMSSFTTDTLSYYLKGLPLVLDIEVKLDFYNAVLFEYIEKTTKGE